MCHRVHRLETGWREGRSGPRLFGRHLPCRHGRGMDHAVQGPLFRRVTGQGKAIGPERLNGKEVARLVKRTAMASGVRGISARSIAP